MQKPEKDYQHYVEYILEEKTDNYFYLILYKVFPLKSRIHQDHKHFQELEYGEEENFLQKNDKDFLPLLNLLI